LWGDRGHAFESEAHAEAVLGMVRHDALRFPAAEAVEQYRRPLDRPSRVGQKLRAWLLWLAKDYQRPGAKRVGIGAKSRLNVLTGFRGFFKWLRRHEQYRALPTPEWPSVAVVKAKRRTMGSLAAQADVIESVPAEHRGVFYAMAHLTLRNGEARALRSGDYDFRSNKILAP
jgi:hypothetical protein